jgi:predicted MFS family arabinose efflux permease
VRVLVAVAALLGALLGGLELGVPAISAAHDAPAASGLLIAALSVGGVLGALAYGAVRWRSLPAVRLLVLLGSLTVPIAAMILLPDLVALGVLALLAGMSINPALTTISLLVDQHTPGRTAAEAFGWLSTGIAVGTGAGNAIAGVAAQNRGDARPAFIVAAVAAAAATVVVIASQRVLVGTAASRPGVRD